MRNPAHETSIMLHLMAPTTVAYGLLLAVGVSGLSAPAAFFAHSREAALTRDAGAEADIPLSGSLNHFIVVPEHKLLFCYVEKVGCTSFNNVFRMLRSRYDKTQGKGSVWLRNTLADHNIDKNKLRQIMKDKTWHKAVFYREPMERFISAYRSKCEGADWRYGRAHCEKMFGSEDVPFKDAVDWIREFDAHHDNDSAAEQDLDEHFKLQTDFCGGLKDTLQYYDTVEELERDTAHEKVSKFLLAAGVKAETIPHFDEFFPVQDDDTWEEKNHNTNSGDHLDKYLPGNQPSLALALMHHYRTDYEVFGIAVPEWAPKLTAELMESSHFRVQSSAASATAAAALDGSWLVPHNISRWPLVESLQIGETVGGSI